MRRLLLCFFLICARSFADSGINLNIEREISVSGISSGGYMAGQFFLSHSEIVKGAGIVAAGPFYCSHGSTFKALYGCMQMVMSKPSLPRLLDKARSFASSGAIDSLENLKKASVYIFAGTEDTTVKPMLTSMNTAFYKELGVKNIKEVNSFAAGHTFPTMDYGGDCSSSDSPWIGNCGKDVAGEILATILGVLEQKGVQQEDSFYRFKQPYAVSLANEGIAYIPSGCSEGARCRLHVALHGCSQGTELLDDEFYKNTGYNEWAESNNIVIVYPQVERSLMNPKGCWDWWGYGGSDFATKRGSQVSALKEIVDSLRSASLQLMPVSPR